MNISVNGRLVLDQPVIQSDRINSFRKNIWRSYPPPLQPLPTNLLTCSKTGKAFLADYPGQTGLQSNNIDIWREFCAFAFVFIEVAKRTLTLAEILAEQKIESLHGQINRLQDRLPAYNRGNADWNGPLEGIGLSGRFEQLNHMGKLLLIFDGWRLVLITNRWSTTFGN